jgi:hypothetical protein
MLMYDFQTGDKQNRALEVDDEAFFIEVWQRKTRIFTSGQLHIESEIVKLWTSENRVEYSGPRCGRHHDVVICGHHDVAVTTMKDLKM